MFTADYHLHTEWSHDSKTSMAETVESSINKGINEICFTDHYELLDNLEKIDYTKYVKEFYDIQSRYKEKIDIKLGVEMGISIENIPTFSNLANSFDFDYVLASTHRVNYVSALWDEYWDGLTKLQGYSKYYEYMYECVKRYYDFDCWGHLDYIIRYGKFEDKGFNYSELGDIIDEILRQLIHNGKGIEVNTSYKNKGNDSFHPSDEIIARYKELGGEIITVGSDSHNSKFVGSHIQEAYSFLESLGFKYISTYKQRKVSFNKICNIIK